MDEKRNGTKKGNYSFIIDYKLPQCVSHIDDLIFIHHFIDSEQIKSRKKIVGEPEIDWKREKFKMWSYMTS